MTGIFSSFNISYRKWIFSLIIGQIELKSCGILSRCVKNNSLRCQQLPISHWFVFCLHCTLSLASYSVTSTVLYKFRSVNCGSIIYSIPIQQGNVGLCILPKILKPWNFTHGKKMYLINVVTPVIIFHLLSGQFLQNQCCRWETVLIITFIIAGFFSSLV